MAIIGEYRVKIWNNFLVWNISYIYEFIGVVISKVRRLSFLKIFINLRDFFRLSCVKYRFEKRYGNNFYNLSDFFLLEGLVRLL